MPELAFEEEMKKVDYWLNELRSLGVNRRKDTDTNELHDLADGIKQQLYHDYKMAYTDS